MEPDNSGQDGEQTANAGHQDQAALLRRVEYLEWLTREMAADLAAMRQQAPNLFRSRVLPQAATQTVATPEVAKPASVEAVACTSMFPAAKPSAPAPANLFASTTKSSRSGSLEAEFGSRVLSKIAIVLLLIGVAWFLKWTFDNRWIGPTGRIIAGLAAGAAVVLWSEHFRKKGMDAFSYALKAVGSGILYLSLWAAFQLYHLMPPMVALLAMIAVTAWNAFMAWSQNAELLAGYALLGAYLTPVLLSTGGDHAVFLFNYLLVVAVAVVALLRTKPWSRLLLGVLPVTTGFFIAWYAEHFRTENAALILGYSIALWTVFATVPFVACEDGTVVGILMPQGTALFGALTIYSVLADSSRKAQEPWWALGFAAIYLVFTRLRSRGISSAMHLSIGIVFLTIAIPLKATGHGITFGWLTESIALMWVATLPSVEAIARKVVRWLAYGSLALGVVGALCGSYVMPGLGHSFANRNFATSLGAILALAVAMYLDSRTHIEAIEKQAHSAFAGIVLITIHVLLLSAMYSEIHALAFRGANDENWAASSERADFLYSGWMMLQGAASLVLGFVKRNPLSRWIGLVLLGITVLKAFLYDMRNLGTGYRVVSYLGLGVVLMAVSFAYQKDWLGLREVVTETPASTIADEVSL